MISINIEKKLHGADGKMKLNLDLQIQKGQLVTLFGESGAGKTSTLRILSGLMQPEKGRIAVNGKIWFDAEKKINLKPRKRKIGYLFQDYALFPNMTVLENLEFALGKNENKTIISELIEMVELGDLQHRKPKTLSGGQQQRVALARALVQQPEILLLDEPLSALDQKIRQKLQDYIVKVHRKFNLTTILISHDEKEILKLSDWIFELKNGELQRQGFPNQIFEKKDSIKIEHLAIWVKDLEGMKQFYETYFNATAGEKYHNPTKKFTSYFLSFDESSRLELMHRPDIPQNINDILKEYHGIIHFAISVGSKEKVDFLTEKLRQDGYSILGEPRTTGDGYYESVVLDPENNRIEITA